MSEEETKVLYKITAYDRDFIKEMPDKARTVGGTNYYYYDFKKHRYLSQFVSDDFDIYDEIKNLQQENSQLKERIEKAIKFIYKNTSYVSIECMEQGLLKSDLDKIIEILKGDKE